jgi:CheY-like chemotaxis protein
MNSYNVKCFDCSSSFDVTKAEWCDCIGESSTLCCPHCGSCFCKTPASFKRRVWEQAPRELREDPRRFGAKLVGLPHPVVSRGHQPVVLVVDDDESMRALVLCVVEHLGYRAVEAAGPHEAIAYCAGDYIDVVITDALMPRMDGREMCRVIKSMPHGANKKVIVMTSLYKGQRFRAEAMGHFGADDYLTKPIDFDQLARALDRLAPMEQREAV